MKTNKKSVQVPVYTHEGCRAKNINKELELQRALMACMLWEDSFYESGEDIAKRLSGLIKHVEPERVAWLAAEARNNFKLRHAPLLVVREMARLPEHKAFVRQALEAVIQRADEIAEFLSIYWKDGRQPISKQVRLGLADAFHRFNEYQFAKYNRDAAVKLRDVLFLSHAKPEGRKEEALFRKIAEDTLDTPDTWETLLSGGCDKRAVFTALIREQKLGALALLRNLRSMAGVDEDVIRVGLANMNTERVLPFRFITAARYAPRFEPELEQAMFRCLSGQTVLPGKTTLLVDVSGSMEDKVSGRSEIQRIDAACGLAMLLREVCQTVSVATFSNNVVEVPARRGFALRDAIVQSQPHGGTYLGQAVDLINHNRPGDRLIVITDEQSADRVGKPNGKGYMINVAAYRNGVGYGDWVHIDGWSEAIVDYIRTYEETND